jgi:hypothetical protein
VISDFKWVFWEVHWKFKATSKRYPKVMRSSIQLPMGIYHVYQKFKMTSWDLIQVDIFPRSARLFDETGRLGGRLSAMSLYGVNGGSTSGLQIAQSIRKSGDGSVQSLNVDHGNGCAPILTTREELRKNHENSDRKITIRMVYKSRQTVQQRVKVRRRY